MKRAQRRRALGAALGFFILAACPARAQAPRADDPAAAPTAEGTLLSFDEALRLGTGGSTAVAQSSESLAIAREQASQTASLYWPDVSGVGKLQHSGDDIGTSLTSRSVGASADLNVYRFGADAARRQSAEALASAAASDRVAAEDAAEAAVADLLFRLIELQQEERIGSAMAKDRRDNLAMAKHLYDKGARPAQDVDKATIDAANEDARLEDTRLKLVKARVDLQTLAGPRGDAAVRVAPEWPWKTALAGPALGRLLAATAGAPAQDGPTARSDRQALVERVRAATSKIDELRARRYPSLDANVGYNYAESRGTQVGFDVGPAGKAHNWSGTLTMTVPLYDRAVAATDERVQIHQRATLAIDLEAKDRELLGERETARASVTQAVASAAARDATLEAARKLYSRSLKSFQGGVLSANDLSLDQSRLHETEINALQGWETAHRYAALLCRNLGRRLTQCLANGAP